MKKISFLFLFFLLWLIGVLYYDPDLWWHLKMGQIITESGIPKTDPFSYSMPSYQYADHEWLSEVLMYKIYTFSGIGGLSFVFALITILTILVLLPASMEYYQLSVFLFASSTLFSFFEIRPQIISWLLFTVVLLITKQKFIKQVFFLPLIFLFWANLHAGFIAGLGILLFNFFVKSWDQKKIDYNYLLIFILASLTSLLNPYAFKLWQEIWLTVSDPVIKIIILEWLPVFVTPAHFFLWVWLIFSSFLVLKYIKKLTFSQKIFYFIFAAASILSSRNFPFYLIITLPPSISFIKKYVIEVQKKNYPFLSKKITLLVSAFFLSLILGRILNIFNLQSLKKQETTYPQSAVNFIRQNPPQDRLFASFGWGGYLIWTLPEQKVFIDGRMSSWRQPALEGEEDYVFREYLKITLTDVDLREFFQKYNISMVLWTTDKDNKDKTTLTLIPFLLKNTGIPFSKKKFIQRVEEIGWKKIYEDQTAVVYERPR